VRVWIQNPFDNLPLEGFRKQRYWLMAEAFAAAGHQVVLWTSDFSHATKSFRKTDLSVSVPFDLRFVPTRSYFRNVGLRRVLSHRDYAGKWLRAGLALGASCRPDVIVSSMPTIAAAETALVLGRRLEAKVVIDVMDAWPETFERLLPAALCRFAHLLVTPLRRQVRRIYREADLVTGVCDRYRALTGRSDYYRAYHGVELCPEPSNPSKPSKPLIRLVYAGCLGRTYDMATVLRAVAENADFRLDIAGRWTGKTPDRVTLHGYLDREGLERLLASCDVGIIPMNADSWVGLPYKLCDYARAGLNVVSCLKGETETLLSKYRCGAVYRPGDAQSFAAAVRKAATLASGGARRMCEEALDAAKIYVGYVNAVEKLV